MSTAQGSTHSRPCHLLPEMGPGKGREDGRHRPPCRPLRELGGCGPKPHLLLGSRWTGQAWEGGRDGQLPPWAALWSLYEVATMAKGQWLPGASVHTTDLPDVSKPVEQRLFIRQHRPLHCREEAALSARAPCSMGRQLTRPPGPTASPSPCLLPMNTSSSWKLSGPSACGAESGCQAWTSPHLPGPPGGAPTRGGARAAECTYLAPEQREDLQHHGPRSALWGHPNGHVGHAHPAGDTLRSWGHTAQPPNRSRPPTTSRLLQADYAWSLGLT